ncbi:DUF285 domain-containing protein, partial [Peptostreptococcaceae bacterium OttesenSCG-928-C18]|nr:DUF285 domain-containing protein [Peptostreptococcaceae bacterium OttesenSCG-928-C18]
MKKKSEIILAGLLLLSMLLHAMPVYATTLEDNSNESKVEVQTAQLNNEKEKVTLTADTVIGMWGTAHWTFNTSTGEFFVGEGDLISKSTSPWSAGKILKENIKTITFLGKVIAPEDSSYLFANFSNLETINNGVNFDTSKAQNMSYMFYKASSLKNLDISSWNTSSATNISGMFNGTSSLKNLDISNWDTSSAIIIRDMFSSATSLESLDLSGWDTSSVTTMDSMFYNTSSLKNLNISTWDTSSVEDVWGMFTHASSLKSLDISGWDMSNVTDMSLMFYDTSSLESLDLSNWDTSNVTEMVYMFYSANSLKSLNISNWDTSSVTDMSGMFELANKLATIKLGKNTIFDATAKLPSLDTYPFNDTWTGKTTGNKYDSSQNFMTNYDGTKPDTYNRNVYKYNLTYMNEDTELVKDAVSVLDEYKIKDTRDFTIKGKVITGWNTEKDGSGTDYPLGTVLTVKDERDYNRNFKNGIILYAKTEERAVTLVGGTGTLTTSVETKLKDFTQTRLSGISRFETAVKV